MHTLYRKKNTPPVRGDKKWFNPTDRTLRIKLMRGTHHEVLEVVPGGSCMFPTAWSDAHVKTVCKFLEPANELEKMTVKTISSAPPPTPEPMPAEAERPLGDASKVVIGKDKKSDHSSDDALEAFAQSMMKQPKASLVATAESLGIPSAGAKLALARAIAKKSIED